MNITNFLIQCYFKGRSCAGDEFWLAWSDAAFGNCFTFNSRYKEEEVARAQGKIAGFWRYTSMTGQGNGEKL